MVYYWFILYAHPKQGMPPPTHPRVCLKTYLLFLVDIPSAESIAVRYYTILFCILIIFAELEWTTTVREMFVFNSWIPRGVLYSL